MLQQINIRNFAIISHLEIDFAPGLNLLTGETGAGKSIIIDALGMALGSRGSSEFVQTGAKQAVVEAVFLNPCIVEIDQLAEETGFALGKELILRRRLDSSGTSKAYINDSQVNVASLRRLGELLVTIHGQSEGDELLGSEGQLSLLDLYAESTEQLKAVSSLFERLRAVSNELDKISTDERARIRELDLLEHQIREIEAAKLDPGEEEETKKQCELLRHSEKIRELSKSAFQQLYAGDGAITSQLAEVINRVAKLADFESSFSDIRGRLEEARFQLEDAANFIRDFLSGIEDDPQTLENLELRLDAINTLRRKYGESVEDVLIYLDKAKERRESLRTADERAGELRIESEKITQEYEKAGAKLSKLRKNAVKAFTKDVCKHLAELAMEKAGFEISLTPHPRGRTSSGIDNVVFMISTNPGEDLKSLARIASGGELSRLMLAIKSCAMEPVSHRTVIFDEVDTGIGGRVAEFVGRKLKRLSNAQQVICITHLPQIAVYANQHTSVLKISDDKKTEVNIHTLSDEERVTELARMLGGEKITDVTREHADELWHQARKYSAKFQENS